MSHPILSKCCGAKLRWVKRLPAQMIGTGEFFQGHELKRKVLGKLVRAYCCEKCGKPDRPTATSFDSVRRLKKEARRKARKAAAA